MASEKQRAAARRNVKLRRAIRAAGRSPR